MNIFATTFHHLCFFSNDFPRLFTTYARYRSLSAKDRASVGAASSRLAGCDKNSEVESGLWPYEERAERPSASVERTRSVWGDSARTVLVHLCDLPSRPKVSLRALILRSNNSAAQ